jgi:hypothetical protein
MKLENQVASLQLSERLKELGAKQESIFYHCYEEKIIGGNDLSGHEIRTDLLSVRMDNLVSAFTASELGEMLPDDIKDEDDEKVYFFQDKYNKCHRVGYVCEANEACSPFIEVKGETETNARAKMLIYLIENGLMKNA